MGSPEPPRRFRRDVAWNVASIAVLALSGVALNAIIARAYGAAALGVFNQVMAAYILFSQLAVGGVNLSALKSIAESPEDRPRTTAIVAGSLALVLALGGLATLAYLLAREPVARALESPGVATGIALSAPGLLFFAVNKVLLSALNGLRRMRSFAVFTGLRYALIVAGLGAWLANDPARVRGDGIAFVFTFSEGLLLLGLAVEVGRQLSFPVGGEWKAWVGPHLRFGVKSFASGILLELNAKVDVWMIGLYLADADVGVYAIAAMVAEGVYQLLVVLQNNCNPLLAKLLAERDWGGLSELVRRVRGRTYAGMAAVAALAIAAFPAAVDLLAGKHGFEGAHAPFALLAAGIVLASGYVPFGQTLLMAGRPGWHSAFMLATVAVNVAGNAILIPRFGIAGSAAATALSMLASVFLLKAFVRAKVGARI
jgi:O-antigen/teichoic acid export membrane protein